MKTDLKIGILVGIVIVVILLVFFISRDRDQADRSVAPDRVVEVQPQPPAPGPLVEPAVASPEPPAERTEPEVILPARNEPPVELQPHPLPEPLPIEPQPEPVRLPRYHTVVEGDSLSNIAETYYGHEKFWPEIQKANRQRINNPNHLQVGWKLSIPYPEELTPKP
jgi:nucleoid-associated protein YgaU